MKYNALYGIMNNENQLIEFDKWPIESSLRKTSENLPIVVKESMECTSIQ